MRFDEERVYKEIDYIAKRTKNAVTLLIADANFGMLTVTFMCNVTY